MKTTTPIRNTGVALANPDSKIHLVTDTIGAYYANSNLGMAKSRNTRLGEQTKYSRHAPIIFGLSLYVSQLGGSQRVAIMGAR